MALLARLIVVAPAFAPEVTGYYGPLTWLREPYADYRARVPRWL
jgi:hypothetical protein